MKDFEVLAEIEQRLSEFIEKRESDEFVDFMLRSGVKNIQILKNQLENRQLVGIPLLNECIEILEEEFDDRPLTEYLKKHLAPILKKISVTKQSALDYLVWTFYFEPQMVNEEVATQCVLIKNFLEENKVDLNLLQDICDTLIKHKIFNKLQISQALNFDHHDRHIDLLRSLYNRREFPAGEYSLKGVGEVTGLFSQFTMKRRASVSSYPVSVKEKMEAMRNWKSTPAGLTSQIKQSALEDDGQVQQQKKPALY